jgi:hypothetical protein
MELHITEIPTALPTFSTMPEQLMLLPTLPDVGQLAQIKILKMADCEPEVPYISGMERHNVEIPTALPTFLIMP